MNNNNTQIPYGLGTGLVLVITQLIFQLTGLIYKPSVSWISYLSYIPYLIGLILNAFAFAKANDNYVSYGKVFNSCFKTSMIVTIVMIAWTLLSPFIFPDMKEKLLELARVKMAEDPRMTDEIMEKSMEFTKKFWNVFIISGILFGYLFFGAILSLLAAIFPPKKGEKPLFDLESK